MRKIVFLSALVLMVFSVAAFSRDGNQRLHFLTNPISTRPLFATSGQMVSIDVKQAVYQSCSCAFHPYVVTAGMKMEFREVGKKLEIEGIAGTARGGSDIDLGIFRFPAKVPDGLAEGVYDINLKKGPNSDNNKKSLVVYNRFPTTYSFMVVSELRIKQDADGESWSDAESLMAKLGEKIAELDPEFVIFNSAITANGAPNELMKFVQLSELIKTPVIAIPGTGDGGTAARGFFGPSNFNFSFGTHNFISWYEGAFSGGVSDTVVKQLINEDAALNVVIAPALAEESEALAFETGANAIITTGVANKVDEENHVVLSTSVTDGLQIMMVDVKDSIVTGSVDVALEE